MKAAAIGLVLALAPGALEAQGAPASVRPLASLIGAPAWGARDATPVIVLRAPILELSFDLPHDPLADAVGSGGVSDIAATAALVDRVPLSVDVESCLESFLPDRRDRRLFDHMAPGLGSAARQYRVSFDVSF